MKTNNVFYFFFHKITIKTISYFFAKKRWLKYVLDLKKKTKQKTKKNRKFAPYKTNYKFLEKQTELILNSLNNIPTQIWKSKSYLCCFLQVMRVGIWDHFGQFGINNDFLYYFSVPGKLNRSKLKWSKTCDTRGYQKHTRVILRVLCIFKKSVRKSNFSSKTFSFLSVKFSIRHQMAVGACTATSLNQQACFLFGEIACQKEIWVYVRGGSLIE